MNLNALRNVGEFNQNDPCDCHKHFTTFSGLVMLISLRTNDMLILTAYIKTIWNFFYIRGNSDSNK